jgi:sugar lactone lactonase YvrE
VKWLLTSIATPLLGLGLATGAVANAKALPPHAGVKANQGVVTTVLGRRQSAGKFGYIVAIAAARNGNLYVSDSVNDTVSEVSPRGKVRLVAGRKQVQGAVDGKGAAARFNQPGGLVADAAGNLFLCDTSNYTIRKITPGGAVSTFAGRAAHEGSTDGTGAAASFMYPTYIAIDAGGNLYVLDAVNGVKDEVEQIRRITPAGVVTTFAQLKALGPNDADTTEPSGIAVDAQGTVYVSDGHHHQIRQVTRDGVVTTLAGSDTPGFQNGKGGVAQFNVPVAIAVDPRGTLFVADAENNRIRQITPGGVVTTLAGSTKGTHDGKGVRARFEWPYALTAAPDGCLYVVEGRDHDIIRKIR